MPSAGPFPSPVMPTQRDADVPNQLVAEQAFRAVSAIMRKESVPIWPPVMR